MRLVLIAAAFALALSSGARALTASHIECWKVKDDLAKSKYTVDQDAEPGCVVQTPPIMACEKTFKTNVTPTPPGGGPNVELNQVEFLCYKEKCPKIVPGGTFVDQFGTHHSNPAGKQVGASLLCVPASPSGAFLD